MDDAAAREGGFRPARKKNVPNLFSRPTGNNSIRSGKIVDTKTGQHAGAKAMTMNPASILFPLVVATEWILGALIVAAAGLSGWTTRRRHDRLVLRSRAARGRSRRL